MNKMTGKTPLQGMKDGIPIGLGYFAVAFSLGIAGSNAGMTVIQGAIMSLLNVASAGQYAGIASIEAGSAFFEIALLILITNARYLLMSCALSQRIDPKTGLLKRLFIGYGITDEIFGLAIQHPYPVNPYYLYASYSTSITLWVGGTACGIVAGNVLPVNIVCALSASIFGMFLAIIIPPGRRDKRVLVVVLASFLISGLLSRTAWVANISESMRVIILTLVISVVAALVFPHKDEEEQAEDGAQKTKQVEGEVK